MVASFGLLWFLELVLGGLGALDLLFDCSLFPACHHAVGQLLKVTTSVTHITRMHASMRTEAMQAWVISQRLHWGQVRSRS